MWVKAAFCAFYAFYVHKVCESLAFNAFFLCVKFLHEKK